MRRGRLEKDVKGVGPVRSTRHFCGQASTGYIATRVVIVDLVEMCVQQIELLSGVVFCYALMYVSYGSAFHQQ